MYEMLRNISEYIEQNLIYDLKLVLIIFKFSLNSAKFNLENKAQSIAGRREFLP